MELLGPGHFGIWEEKPEAKDPSLSLSDLSCSDWFVITSSFPLLGSFPLEVTACSLILLGSFVITVMTALPKFVA